MVDFSKRLGKKSAGKPLDPIEIYETLDRASDKGPLRPAQSAILKDWHEKFRSKRDVILKLHTGQGKTLIGLLILQSKLHEDGGSAVYLCANNFLIDQTCSQAKQFGVQYCKAEGDLPDSFTDGKSILITSVQKVFNGQTKFGLGQQSVPVSSILMDDCHACIDSIRDKFTIKISHEEPAYNQIRELFTEALENQGAGTYADICSRNTDALLPVPYWDWQDKQPEVIKILSKHTSKKYLVYTWPIVKDLIQECRCVISGESLEITPYLPPLDLFGSYYKAKHRVFMSATVTDDSFLVKGLRLTPDVIRNPLIYKDERWSGEKMILIPSLIDDSLDRSMIVKEYGTTKVKGRHGTVALVPSFRSTRDWKEYGAIVATKETINSQIERLKNGAFDEPLVIANRYDGIDLPDDTCRILIFDSKPHSVSLIDRYEERCRETSEITAIRTARAIEQGLGRSVRGEKDYCVIILIGKNLIKTIRSRTSREYLSNQTRLQIETGLEIAEMAKEEIEKGMDPLQALQNLVSQCLKRDPAWKAFYVEKMEGVAPKGPGGKVLDIFKLELEAETFLQAGDSQQASATIQRLIDQYITDDSDKGWYLQEMARHIYLSSKIESNKLQIEAHKKNRFLMKPRTGMKVDRLKIISQKRMESIIEWIKSFGDFDELILSLESMLSNLEFGVTADRFEQAFDELGKALGFSSEQPDKEWKQGPDNLWGIRDNEYLLVECKSEVSLERAEINKEETGQMNNACAWFAKYYKGASATRIMIIPTNKVSKAAGFNENVEIMRKAELSRFKANVRSFFLEFKDLELKNISEKKVQELIDAHGLSIDSILANYSKKIRL